MACAVIEPNPKSNVMNRKLRDNRRVRPTASRKTAAVRDFEEMDTLRRKGQWKRLSGHVEGLERGERAGGFGPRVWTHGRVALCR